jgi:hypothetical protein
MNRSKLFAPLFFLIAVLSSLTMIGGCGQSEPEKPKGGTYYEGPMKPKSVNGG